MLFNVLYRGKHIGQVKFNGNRCIYDDQIKSYFDSPAKRAKLADSVHYLYEEKASVSVNWFTRGNNYVTAKNIGNKI